MRGAWIEMLRRLACLLRRFRRSPCGERGLKWLPRPALPVSTSSLPVRGAWIEMTLDKRRKKWYRSLPVRGAWIEILFFLRSTGAHPVAPRAGSVD